MKPDVIEQYIKDLKKYRKQADNYMDGSPAALIRRVELLTQAREIMGRVSAHMDGEYKRTEAQRKITYAQVKRDTPRGDKETTAELAISELRMKEAESYESMHLWRNELVSLTEHIHELRLKLRIEINTGGE